jgi:endogenous inhibitor of DNA gyrase (YacG/DUF329 family)
MMDLGTWSSESYRIPDQPEVEAGEGWSELPGFGSDEDWDS